MVVVASGTNVFAKEMAIRKRIANMMKGKNEFWECILPGILPLLIRNISDEAMCDDRYNKREEDFPSLREYNDYLEEVEDMIVNLVDGIDVPAIEARIAQYQSENAEQIMNAQARKAEEYAAALAASKGQLPQTGVDLSSNSQAGSSTVPRGQYAPAVAGGGIAQPRPLGPLGSGVDMMGLEYEDEETMKLLLERAARAGGWSVEISRKRALEEAFASIMICY